MNIERLLIYGLAVVLVVVALARRSNSLKARRIEGNVVIGDTTGPINQTYNAPPPSKDSNREPGDRIAWVIGIVGVVIAAAQLAHDVLK